MDESSVGREAVLQELNRLLASRVFRRAERSSTLLRYLVEQTLNGRADELKEFTLGAEGLGRGDTFDPRSDPVVRAEASRLRSRLDQYYGTIGRDDAVRIVLNKGSYIPEFVRHDPTTPAVADTLPNRPPAIVRLIRQPTIAWIAAAIAGAIAVGLGMWIQTRPTEQLAGRSAQFEVELNADGALASDVGTTVVLSPDGTRIVFVSQSRDGRTHLNVRELDQREPKRLMGTEGARAPFVSFDSRWVGFWADGKLKKVAIDGGSPVVLCDAADLLGASWGEDDTIIAALGTPGQLSRVHADGGMPAVAIDLRAEAVIPRWPQILPGGRAVLYTAMGGAGADRANIEGYALVGGDRKVLVQGATFARYLDSGYLTYVNQGTLFAARFDPVSLTVQGRAFPLLDDVSYSSLFGYAQLDVSRTGMLVYRRGLESQRAVVNRIDRTGNVTSVLSMPGRYSWMRLSPDGQRLAVTSEESGIASISVYDLKTRELTRVSRHPGEYTGLTWLPGDLLAFGGANGLGLVDINASAPLSLLSSRVAQTPWSVTPDGQRLAYFERSSETGFDLWTVPVHRSGNGVSAGRPEPFLRSAAFEVYPAFSPDGRWLAYASNESGRWEIYVRPFSRDATKIRVSAAGGVVPRWSPNGRELLYRTSEQHVMVVPYQLRRDTFVPGTAGQWSNHVLTDTGVIPNFDVSSTGNEILALMSVADAQTLNHVTLMLNVVDEIRRRAESR